MGQSLRVTYVVVGFGRKINLTNFTCPYLILNDEVRCDLNSKNVQRYLRDKFYMDMEIPDKTFNTFSASVRTLKVFRIEKQK